MFIILGGSSISTMLVTWWGPLRESRLNEMPSTRTWEQSIERAVVRVGRRRRVERRGWLSGGCRMVGWDGERFEGNVNGGQEKVVWMSGLD